ncbi:hypothetical protein PORY_002295 [Pneumocystis oryctolagi]|uniref:Uncharacterized protein n=1 Tax=Pneumocystis oryctolagi TaxID=42067 RepID=A0ACB7CAB5_9ASCO|nr:hypothetical protein PORY_002295 [Pneumocystis oryctolagi]
MTKTKINLESHLILEQTMVRLPYELLRMNFKMSQKYIEKNSNYFSSAIEKLSFNTKEETEASIQHLNVILLKIQELKGKLLLLNHEDIQCFERFRARINHLKALCDIDSIEDGAYDSWSQTRLDCLLIDYMLRKGMNQTAKQLAKEKNIQNLVDIDLFIRCKDIENALKNKNTTKCLSWCVENRAFLRKNRINLEFELKLQEYIELVRKNELSQAIAYSRKYLVPYAELHMEEFKRAMALLIFPPHTECEYYKKLYSSERWMLLADLFVLTHHNLYNLSIPPLLYITLSAGLSALKTPSCCSIESQKVNTTLFHSTLCPICSPELNSIASLVPYAHAVRSSLIDLLTGEKIKSDNELIVLPNGHVYNQKSLFEKNEKFGIPKDTIWDPATTEKFPREKIRKVFIM